jgi:hypothetical protein
MHDMSKRRQNLLPLEFYNDKRVRGSPNES